MMRGYSLEQDLRLLINNPKYSDIEILCGDEKKLYGCRAILAARSEVLDKLLYNGMKESYENKIYFPEINSSEMMIILEYTYAGLIKEESLTMDNIVEAFYAADYFQLSGLQDIIMKAVEKNYAENYSPELLSKIADKIPFSEDDIFLNLLVEAVAIIPLNTIEFGRLSIEGLQYLLSYTHEKENPFATSEYEVFRYSAILAAKRVSNDSYKTLMKWLPTLEQLENSTQVENKTFTDHRKVAKELGPLTKFIDFRRIKSQIFADIIEPLGIIPIEMISNIYQNEIKSNNLDFNEIRGSLYFWDMSACGPNLIIENNGKVVQAQNSGPVQSVRAKMTFDSEGIFEWDVIIEKSCIHTCWVGVCASENFSYETYAGEQPTEWVLCSTGNCWNSEWIYDYCPSFGDGAKITVHLDMNKRTLAFTVNGTKYANVSGCNLPSKLHPVVSLSYPGHFRIQPHRKA